MNNYAKGKIDLTRIQANADTCEKEIRLLEEKLSKEKDSEKAKEIKETIRRESLTLFDYKRTLNSIKYE